MSQPPQTTVRRLGPGDEDVVRKLAEREPQTELLHDDRTIFLAAFRDGERVLCVKRWDVATGEERASVVVRAKITFIDSPEMAFAEKPVIWVV